MEQACLSATCFDGWHRASLAVNPLVSCWRGQVHFQKVNAKKRALKGWRAGGEGDQFCLFSDGVWHIQCDVMEEAGCSQSAQQRKDAQRWKEGNCTSLGRTTRKGDPPNGTCGCSSAV